MSTNGIYEDVELLKEQVAALQEQMTADDLHILEENADILTLGEGVYLIPNATVCATLQNKPTTSTSTGFVKVEKGGSSGQLIVHYVLCTNTPKYYYNAYYSSAWKGWKLVDHTDTGWIDLTLTNGATIYNSNQKPQYRKIGSQVFLRGIFCGITERTTIATLPAGYRPSQRIMVNTQRTGYGIDRVEIETDGSVNYIGTNAASTGEITWHSFHDTSFFVD